MHLSCSPQATLNLTTNFLFCFNNDVLHSAGRLALHWAIERLLSLPILLSIDNANPTDAAFVADTQGM